MRHIRCLLLILSLVFSAAATPPPSLLEHGQLDGAFYAIASPPEGIAWNGSLLLLAHGFRPETAPVVADLNPNHLAYQTLLNQGWIVAKTSYRRNGIIVADALLDLDNLRQHIAEKFGPPRRVIVEGDSMGGTIATLMAERGGRDYQGFVAVGAALDLRETDGANGVAIRPQIPLLFVANRSEIAGPSAYVETAKSLADSQIIAPKLFRIDRDGHVNVNQAERLFAIESLGSWLDRGGDSLPRLASTRKGFDATHPPPPQASQVKIDSDQRGLVAQVTDISAIYGNAWINLQPHDLIEIGLTPGLWFEAKIHDQTYRVRYGKDFSSVEKGQWVIFPNADGYFWLSRNWANAAETAKLSIGDTIHLRRYNSE